MSVGTQQDGIDVFKRLVAEDYVEVLCPVQRQQVHRLWLESLPLRTELTATGGHSVITILMERAYGVCIGEAIIKDVGVGRGQAHTIQTVHFHTRCWESCQQVT